MYSSESLGGVTDRSESLGGVTDSSESLGGTNYPLGNWHSLQKRPGIVYPVRPNEAVWAANAIGRWPLALSLLRVAPWGEGGRGRSRSQVRYGLLDLGHLLRQGPEALLAELAVVGDVYRFSGGGVPPFAGTTS
jgi:hypothetical protein